MPVARVIDDQVLSGEMSDVVCFETGIILQGCGIKNGAALPPEAMAKESMTFIVSSQHEATRKHFTAHGQR